MSGYQPDFDIDRAYGEQGEDGFRAVLRLRGAEFEVKRKSRLDDKFYIETAQDPERRGSYKPSGINTSRASHWVYVLGDSGVLVLIPRSLLREAALGGRRVEESDGNNPTKGRLVSLSDLMSLSQRRAAA